jgi:hypothetical protein
MGLFGLATLTVTRRTKEIGIRKVLGANAIQLVTAFIKRFFIACCYCCAHCISSGMVGDANHGLQILHIAQQ